MSLFILIILNIALAYSAFRFKDKLNHTLVEILRWVVVLIGWAVIGEGLLNGLAAFLVSQAVYVPASNYLNDKDIWFIEDDTWYGKLAIKYLGEGSGKVLFFAQLILGTLLIIL
jgi:hypothetical protein